MFAEPGTESIEATFRGRSQQVRYPRRKAGRVYRSDVSRPFTTAAADAGRTWQSLSKRRFAAVHNAVTATPSEVSESIEATFRGRSQQNVCDSLGLNGVYRSDVSRPFTTRPSRIRGRSESLSKRRFAAVHNTVPTPTRQPRSLSKRRFAAVHNGWPDLRSVHRSLSKRRFAAVHNQLLAAGRMDRESIEATFRGRSQQTRRITIDQMRVYRSDVSRPFTTEAPVLPPFRRSLSKRRFAAVHNVSPVARVRRVESIEATFRGRSQQPARRRTKPARVYRSDVSRPFTTGSKAGQCRPGSLSKRRFAAVHNTSAVSAAGLARGAAASQGLPAAEPQGGRAQPGRERSRSEARRRPPGLRLVERSERCRTRTCDPRRVMAMLCQLS